MSEPTNDTYIVDTYNYRERDPVDDEFFGITDDDRRIQFAQVTVEAPSSDEAVSLACKQTGRGWARVAEVIPADAPILTYEVQTWDWQTSGFWGRTTAVNPVNVTVKARTAHEACHKAKSITGREAADVKSVESGDER